LFINPKGDIVQAYICSVCGFLYDDESADLGPDNKRLSFAELDDEWICPICGVKKELFKETESERPHDIEDENNKES
jgi:rubredoxin